jgi:hypothetical protein
MSGRSRSVAVIAAAMLVLAPGAQAASPTLATITAHLRTSAQYDDPAAKVTPAQKVAITKAINAARSKGNIVRVAILAAPPPDAPGATAAPRLRARLKLAGTLVVALPTSVQISSINVAGKRLAGVRAAAAGKGGFAGARAAINAITSRVRAPVTTPTTPVTTTTQTGKSGGGGIASWIYIAIAAAVLALAAVLTALRLRTRRVRKRGGGSLIEGARTLLQGRLQGLGEVLASTAVGVSEREDPALTNHHRNAAETVAEVRGSIGRLDGPPAFRAAHGRLDDAEWHLGVVQAHLEQSGEPPRPESGHPARCFFNADHGLATVEIELELPGVRTVSVGICAADAVRLARGDEPEIGAVTVGRRRLPWAAAPTWYGGWGWGPDDLPSLRYHGQPVFSSTSQLDAFAATTGTVSRVRPVSSAGDLPDASDEFDAPSGGFVPDELVVDEEEPPAPDSPQQGDEPAAPLDPAGAPDPPLDPDPPR